MRRPFQTWTGALLLAGAMGFSAACSEEPIASAQTPAAPSNPDQVVAEVAGKPITLKDVDAKWEEFDAAERARIIQATYQNRRNMIDVLVGDQLIANAAKAAGQSVDAYVSQEGAKKLPPVSEAQIAQFYEQNKERAQGRTLDQLRGEIKPFLEARREQQARAMLVEDLKAKTGANVKVMLEAPRYTVPTSTDDPVRGNTAAPVTIVEFSDYQCPFCARVNPTLAKIRETYGDRVKIVFKDYPLPNHPQAPKAAEAARCAGDQKKYWEMHDAMFANQRALEVPALKQTARAIGLDGGSFDQCLESGKWAATVTAGSELGEKMGVNSTPTLYVNGRPLIGAMPFENFKSIIDEELARR
ncbi:MAG TPA: thioredoxin domain-containing protein [Vicinamibacterales bacterium]|nr:thioredoxin domain-containing protein [Vicinamibacterales bacterium]